MLRRFSYLRILLSFYAPILLSSCSHLSYLMFVISDFDLYVLSQVSLSARSQPTVVYQLFVFLCFTSLVTLVYPLLAVILAELAMF